MTQVMDRATIDYARARLLDERDGAQERLDEASLKAALPGGDDQEMIAAEAEVSRINQKLAGLALGLQRVEAQDQLRHDAEAAAKRRADAVEILGIAERRYAATVDLDRIVRMMFDKRNEIEELGDELTRKSAPYFADDLRGQENFRNFLMFLNCADQTDTVFQFDHDVVRLRRYSEGLLTTRPIAMRALAKAMPEVEDEAVQAEARASVQPEDAEA